MRTVRSSLSHEERTSTEPREEITHTVLVEGIKRVNDSIKLFRLDALDQNHGIKFLPGQWLDVFVSGLTKAGGFTITSTPKSALPPGDVSRPYLELAVQKSPSNPPAAWFWRHEDDIVGSELRVRVGGSFIWPPTCISGRDVKNIVFVAGGVGINPLISMVTHLHETDEMPPSVKFLYGTKSGSRGLDEILFVDRLQSIQKLRPGQFQLDLFLTGKLPETQGKIRETLNSRRITSDDLISAIGDVAEREATVCYICGPPPMTDEFVAFLQDQEGIAKERVLCEKWW
ncbi:ferredoxin reductase-like protein [Patellaria atrata CBS 101060]|uniref:Ferredoxin reductase-like protein n=1 Tax=Patellaria atrata CBS 101060 TaxID=1346257 RepID=A0A9P4VNJ9_9PEZI|nr:ferredoxin reductase-like protein [Patellaria atrata CBS 101060]